MNQTAAELRPVNDSIVKDYITLAVKNVFSTMIRKEAVLVAPNQGPSWRDDPDAVQFSSRVAFRGNINGAVTLCFPESFVKEAASVILGISTRELELQGDDMLRDVVGEIANMIAGTFKNALCDLGYPCKLTLPEVLKGTSLKVVELPSASCHVFSFDCALDRLRADVQLLHP